MSDSDDDWFNKDLSEFSIDEKRDDTESQSNPIVVHTTNDNAVHYGNRTHQIMTSTQPMSTSKLRLITEQTPVVAFLEILQPDSGFFQCLKRKSNSLATILLLAKAICNGCRVPFDESVKCLCDFLVDEQNFWNQCIKYLTESTYLPTKARSQNDATISDGMEIWNDVISLCRTIVNHEIRVRKTFLKQVIQLIENNKNDLLLLDQHMIELNTFLHYEQPRSSRNLLPSLEEIKSGNLSERNVTFFNGKYKDISQYKDIHLALLRVDFLLPIRCTVEKIISKEDTKDPCVYRHVEILITQKEYRTISRNEVKKTVCIVADLELKRRKTITGPSYYSVKDYNQHFTPGSLLFFTTSDEFNDLIIAKVQSRNSALLKRGYIDIVIVKTYNIESVFEQSFIMYERHPYFYREIYEVLKNFTENTFPLRENLIGVDTNIGYPSYVPDQQKVIYKYRKHKVDIKNPTSWSSSEAAATTFNLDASQLNALQRALTQKLCAISTSNHDESVVIASEIIAMLFHNTDRRILIVCHSGKALTKILADVEMYTDNIARIASHNINDELDHFNLNQIQSNRPGVGIWKLINAYRYTLHSGYRDAVNEFTELQLKQAEMQDNFMDKYLRIQTQLESFSKRLDEMRQIADFESIKSKRIIGITGYGASKFQALIQLLQSPIVIIEGAHNILEAHTIATLTTNLEHLILIGQKRMSNFGRHTSTFALSKIYNVNFSLFERLLIGSGQSTQSTKKVTSRGGPSILDILYTRKKSERPVLMGIEKFVFVLEHRKGISNPIEFESHFILALCNYFLKQGYDHSDIVMVAMNCHQMQRIIDDRKIYEDRVDEFTNLCKVRVDFVMNFKEKNNGIVLLSTTQTKDDNSSKLSQEIQNLFSKAKLGVFAIGSLPTDKHLKKIGKAIVAEAAINVEMELFCQTHGNVTTVKEATDIDKLQFGGCETICNQPLPCGHLCKNICHTGKYLHQECLCSGSFQ
ncbi:uncharacterized protein LOC119071146 [Bradysia coprophila]|uniref:uncharacterized protein LOC119071146 n=1 Tax=Bradysia coprophila TaxID=38358 RepID=UPI00187DBF68|nr:uncharacterized protein LOC119071146 [Bradysia coprophila]